MEYFILILLRLHSSSFHDIVSSQAESYAKKIKAGDQNHRALLVSRMAPLDMTLAEIAEAEKGLASLFSFATAIFVYRRDPITGEFSSEKIGVIYPEEIDATEAMQTMLATCPAVYTAPFDKQPRKV